MKGSILARGFAGLSLMLVALSIAAQPAGPASTGGAAAASPPAPLAGTSAIAPEAVSAAAQGVAGELAGARMALENETSDLRIAKALPRLTVEITARFAETARLTADSPTVADLRELRGAWKETAAGLADWQRELTEESDRLQKQAASLDQLSRQWEATLKAARGTVTPPDVMVRIERTVAEVRRARAAVDARRNASLSLLEQIATQTERTLQARNAVDAAIRRVVDELLERQAPAAWNMEFTPAARGVGEGQRSLAAQLAALNQYLGENREDIGMHLAVIVALAALLYTVRRRVHAWATEVPALARTEAVFDFPIASALILSVIASRWIYEDAPHLFWSVAGGIVLVPAVIILRHIARRNIIPALYALLVVYLVEQLRGFTAASDPLSRVIFLAEVAGGIAFAYLYARWLTSSHGPDRTEPPEVDETGADRLVPWGVARAAARAAMGLLAAAAVAHVLGFISLGELIAGGVLTAAGVAVILYAAALIADALVLLALHARPLAYSRLVRRHTDSLFSRAQHVIRWIAVAVWALVVLDRLTLRDRLVAAGKAVLAVGVKAGSLDISIGDLLAFGLTLWVALLIARFANFVLEEDVFPRSTLPRGLPYAIKTTVRYSILLIGFVAAVAVLGVDMTKLTILVGALTVGIGFGLQNIINNFVSGLILLFERPVKVGDVIQIGDATGVVQRIGIRATVVSTAAGSQIIVPNGQFISTNVTNLTGLSGVRPVQISIAVVSASDVRLVLETLTRAAAGCRGVLTQPAPRAILSKLGPDSLLFDLRVWTSHDEDWPRVITEVTLAASEGLRQANIAIK